MERFKARCQAGFQEAVRKILELEASFCSEGKEDAAFRAALVVHGGTIMAVLERFGFPKKIILTIR